MIPDNLVQKPTRKEQIDQCQMLSQQMSYNPPLRIAVCLNFTTVQGSKRNRNLLEDSMSSPGQLRWGCAERGEYELASGNSSVPARLGG
ncbi:hypothetical protein WUBG_12238 [Wuchereria bancrofti]|uniref:Uncharacterized protein n=1 Tax=Wuchereria bancrofti TaxID=6293 RepID=J9AR55_WUCBA|nr:hypothetical protein WUBG_12238 [Wuchereria bancrofti]